MSLNVFPRSGWKGWVIRSERSSSTGSRAVDCLLECLCGKVRENDQGGMLESDGFPRSRVTATRDSRVRGTLPPGTQPPRPGESDPETRSYCPREHLPIPSQESGHASAECSSTIIERQPDIVQRVFGHYGRCAAAPVERSATED